LRTVECRHAVALKFPTARGQVGAAANHARSRGYCRSSAATSTRITENSPLTPPTVLGRVREYILFLHYSIRTEKGLLLDPKVSSIPSDASSNPFWACHRSIVVRSGKGGKDRPLTPPKT